MGFLGDGLFQRAAGIVFSFIFTFNLATTSSVFAKPTPTEIESEVKMPVLASAIEEALKILKLKSKDAEKGRILYLDTKNLILRKSRLVLRLRESEKGIGDLTVKVRPFQKHDLTDAVKEMLEDGDAKMDLDLIKNQQMEALSIREKDVDRPVARALGDKDFDLEKELTKSQRKLLKALLNQDEVDWKKFKALGPAKEKVWTDIEVDGFDDLLDVELWTFPDGHQALEISFKSDPQEAFSNRKKCRKTLEELGIKFDPNPTLKTDQMYDHARSTR